MRSSVLIMALVLISAPAFARFGKAGSGSSNSSNSASGSGTHSAAPVDSGASGSGSASGSGGSPGSSNHLPRPWYGSGYYAGAFVPWYGYGYAATPGWFWSTRTGVVTPGVPAEPPPPTNLRATAGVDFVYLLGNAERGFTLGVNGGLEGERWGFNVQAQNIAVAADDGSDTVDTLQQVSAHFSFAFLTGAYGRLRAELGADTIVAPSAVFFGPTVGLSGVLWIGGPFALESNVYGTVYPFWQLDWKAALVLGTGPIGFKLGWRTQVLDDRGAVDGVVHRDVFMGPYAAVGLAF